MVKLAKLIQLGVTLAALAAIISGCGLLSSLSAPVLPGNATSYDGMVEPGSNGLSHFDTPDFDDALIKLWGTDLGNKSVQLEWTALSECSGVYEIYVKEASGWLLHTRVDNNLSTGSEIVQVGTAGTQFFVVVCGPNFEAISNVASVEVTEGGNEQNILGANTIQLSGSAQSQFTVALAWSLKGAFVCPNNDVYLFRQDGSSLTAIPLQVSALRYSDSQLTEGHRIFSYFIGCSASSPLSNTITVEFVSAVISPNPISLSGTLAKSKPIEVSLWWTLSSVTATECPSGVSLYRQKTGAVAVLMGTISSTATTGSYVDSAFSSTDSGASFFYYIICGTLKSNIIQKVVPTISAISMVVSFQASLRKVTVQWVSATAYACPGGQLSLVETTSNSASKATESSVVATFIDQESGSYTTSFTGPSQVRALLYKLLCSSQGLVLASRSVTAY